MRRRNAAALDCPDRQENGLKPIPLPRLGDDPLVSVLIANYNYAAFLGDAIESVLRQTYGNFELIVCDDGSTDGSWDIINRYREADPRITGMRQSNAGHARAMNAAFQQSKGEVICLLDSDDAFLPTKLEKVVQAFAGSPQSGLAVNRMFRVDKNRRRLCKMPVFHRLEEGWYGATLDLAAGPPFLPGLVPCSGLSLRRAVAELILPLPKRLRFADVLVLHLGPLITPIVAIETPLSEYRILHGGNSGGTARCTEEQLERWVGFHTEIWSQWHSYLQSALPDSSRSKQSLPSKMAPSVYTYALARFRSDPKAKKIHSELVNTPFFRAMSRLHRWYWRTAAFLPRAAFLRSFGILRNQDPAKILLSRTLQACLGALSAATKPRFRPAVPARARGVEGQRPIGPV